MAEFARRPLCAPRAAQATPDAITPKETPWPN